MIGVRRSRHGGRRLRRLSRLQSSSESRLSCQSPTTTSQPVTRASSAGVPSSKGTSAIKPHCATHYRKHEMTSVLHFAACAYVGESVINPQKYYDNNVSRDAVAAARDARYRLAAIVFSSSCAIYGEPEQMPITESCAKQPVNPYGASKLVIERVLMDYIRAYGIQYVALEIFQRRRGRPRRRSRRT